MSADRPAPLCHRMVHLLPRYVHHDSAEPHPACSSASASACACACLCRGSACSLWVPATVGPNGPNQRAWPAFIADADGAQPARNLDSGRGWCADNLRCRPWPDPAARGEE